MIEKAKINDIQTIQHLVYEMNNQSRYYSGYMSCDNDIILKELKTVIKKGNMLVYKKHNKIIGMVILGQYDESTINYDCAGPYVSDGDIEVAIQLLQKAKEQIAKGKNINFFFSKESQYYQDIMQEINATFKTNEYILRLDKENFKPIKKIILDTHQMIDNEKYIVKDMHHQIFPDAYITAEMVVSNQGVYILKRNNEYAGFLLIKEQKKRFYLELFGLLKPYRGQGLAIQFLSVIINHKFKTSKLKTCELVVEADNSRALKIYTDIGFTIDSIQVSYKLE